MKKRKKIREGNRIATIIMYGIAAFTVFITLYPMYYVFILSLSDPAYAITMQVYTIPKGFSLSAYETLVKDNGIWRALANTVLYASSVTILMLITSMMMAFPLTFKSIIGRKFINMYLLITMFFSGGMIPTFLLILRLGLYDTPLSLIIPACFSIWNIILTKSYLGTIPETLREAAKIDGASIYQILFRIYLPLSKPILAVIAVYTVVSVWNSWFTAAIYLPHLDWQPLQIYLRRMLISAESTSINHFMDAETIKQMMLRKLSFAQIKYAMIFFSSLPVIFTYPFFQKYFMKGIMLGSLKE
jgi:putative aldouronate transport system permease protein